MTQRIDPSEHGPDLYRVMLQFDAQVRRSALPRTIQGLVKVRASQVNGCAYCVDMHTKDARSIGETEQRLYGLAVWRETPFYDARERAALALTDALCMPPDHERLETARAEVAREFTADEQVALVFAIGLIRSWNSIGVGLQSEVGTYEPEAAVA
jgi:AhpD family alkylhydroperoxidase